jgi:hypothetical protein
MRYRTLVADSARWEGFEFRDGDIIISTPPKCGTTWTQMICALLIFQTADLNRPLDQISPWLDQNTKSRDEVFADLAAQDHRRFIKSHTPLDGLPWDERVTYVAVGRDPRDVAISMAHHFDNMDFGAFLALIDSAVGLDKLADVMSEPEPPPTTPIDRFWAWVDDDTPLGRTLGGLAGTLHHLSTFWQARERPNVVLLHYGELKADLVGQMRRLAAVLDIDIEPDRLAELAPAASFESMRERAKTVAPNTTDPIWVDSTSFFHRGTSGQWRDLLDDVDLKRYAGRVAALVGDDFSNWAHQGPIIG